jgi:hypothetical protein
MSYYSDPEINTALVNLLEALANAHKRDPEAHKSTIIFIPNSEDEQILIAEDGKTADWTGFTAEDVARYALGWRKDTG